MFMNPVNSNDDLNQLEELEEQEELSEEQAKSISGGLVSVPDGNLYPSGSSSTLVAENESQLRQ
jgi:hypothetical protein